jgi:hypothetical protein
VVSSDFKEISVYIYIYSTKQIEPREVVNETEVGKLLAKGSHEIPKEDG